MLRSGIKPNQGLAWVDPSQAQTPLPVAGLLRVAVALCDEMGVGTVLGAKPEPAHGESFP